MDQTVNQVATAIASQLMSTPDGQEIEITIGHKVFYIRSVDHEQAVPLINAEFPLDVIDGLGIPSAGCIVPRPDPVYGHVFHMPDLSALDKPRGKNGRSSK